MTISDKDLFLAILAMDSYNRGTGAGIDGLSSEAGTTIGTATIGIDSSDDAGIAEDVGFYAVSYDTDYGTVISYRGTDFFPAEDLHDDVRHGWSMGGGNYTALQTPLSVDFLNAVKQQIEENIILTGNSQYG